MIFGTMRNNWWTRLRVRIAWGIRRPGMLRYLEQSVKGNRDAGKKLTGLAGDRRKCLCGRHAYNVICGSELIYEAFAPGVFSVIQEPWFETKSDPDVGEEPWTPRDSQVWLSAREVQRPRVILGPIEGAFVGFSADQWRFSAQTETDIETGNFPDGQRFIPNPPGTFKGTLQLGERYFFAYDWARPSYCGQKLAELGFRPEDLTP